jgi:hypothetical protein
MNAQPILNETSEQLARLIEANSEPGQVVFTTDASLGNLITGLTGRPSTGGMFREVQATPGTDAWRSATFSPSGYLAIPSKGKNGARAGAPAPLDLSTLEYVGSAGTVALYRNPQASDVTVERGPVVPWLVVLPLLLLAAAAITVDWVRKPRAR